MRLLDALLKVLIVIAVIIFLRKVLKFILRGRYSRGFDLLLVIAIFFVLLSSFRFLLPLILVLIVFITIIYALAYFVIKGTLAVLRDD